MLLKNISWGRIRIYNNLSTATNCCEKLIRKSTCRSRVTGIRVLQAEQSRVMPTAVQNVLSGMLVCDGAWCKDNWKLCLVAVEHTRDDFFVTLEAKHMKEEALKTVHEEYGH